MQHEAVKMLHTDKLADIVGGRYALTSLVAKRMRQLNGGAQPLVEEKPGERLIELVCREIETGKIWIEKPEISEIENEGFDDISELMDME
ncbi:MAG: DNA-directed RNA polymerase subunit omega [Planctomycetota bacterium]|jgi:DNA-directed RNA polymerase omega subunit